MFPFVLILVITTSLLLGFPNKNGCNNRKSQSFGSSSNPFGVVDAFQFQLPTCNTGNRGRRFSSAVSALKITSKSELPVASTTRPNGGDSSARDREEDLKLTIETIMQFIGSNSNSNNEFPVDVNFQEQNDPKRRPPVDHKMNSKYEELALLVKEAVEKQQQQQKIDETDNDQQPQTQPQPQTTWWCAVTGGPGSGKSTLAKKVSKICNEKFGISSIVVPMDGYLFSRSDLSAKLELDPQGCIEHLRRRGSPHTVDAENLCKDLAAASGRIETIQNSMFGAFGGGERDINSNNEHDDLPPKQPTPSPFSFPEYRRTAPSDPIPEQIHFDPSHHNVVFVEGEYLLLGKGGMIPGYVTETESRRWKPLLDFFDSTWFVSCQQQEQEDEDEETRWYNYDFEEQRKRRILYHLEEDEDNEETVNSLFPSFSSGGGASQPPLSKEDVATKRTVSNDALNMLIAETCKQHASLVIRSA